MNTLVKNSAYTSIKPMDDWLVNLAQQGKIDEAPALENDSRVFETIREFQKLAQDNFNLINSTILENSQQVYRDIISQTTAAVMTGFKTHQQALAETSANWAKAGIPALIDSAGRKWSIEGYIPMVTKSMSNNVANQTQFNRMDSYNLDLIEISSHLGARPLCAPYQGRIYSRNGKSTKYPSLESTSYGKPAGIFGINCHHHPYPYIPGGSVQRYDPYPAGENSQAYAESQQQRAMERDIRKAKRKLNIMQQMGTEKEVAAAKQKVREKQAAMRAFIADSGRTRRRDREQLALKNPNVGGGKLKQEPNKS